MQEFSKDDLLPLINFSVYDNLGNDSWSIFSIPQNNFKRIAYFSQNVRGWESEEWYSFDLNEKNNALLNQILDLKDSAEQLKLMHLIEKK